MLSEEQKKLLYRAVHRGTKEMDWLVGNFVAEIIKTLKDDERNGLALLLNLSDADIYDLLYGIMTTQELFGETGTAGMSPKKQKEQQELDMMISRMQKHYGI